MSKQSLCKNSTLYQYVLLKLLKLFEVLKKWRLKLLGKTK